MKKHRPSRFDKLAIVLTILLVSTLSSHALDLDGDGMSDVWQRIHNIATGDTAKDIDGDGQRNGKEAEAGTNPRDPNDYFRTFDFSINATLDEASISWRSVEERYYVIEQSTDLVSWDYAAYGYGEYDQTTTSTTFYPYPSGQSKMFFRVRGYPEYDYDYDGDGLQSWEERLLETDPYDYDGDTDNDGMGDGFEFIYEFDPLSAADAQQDADGDHLSNAWETALGLNPRLADSNGNGINDANEDRDFDGLSNLTELQTHGTDPSQPDTDSDGLFDGWEIANGFNPLIDNTTDGNPNNDPAADPDSDGLTNSQEADHGTSTSSSDTDGDGVGDATEVGQGSNPTDPNDSQPPPAGTVAVNITFGDDSGSHSERYRVRLVPLEGDTSGNSQRFRTNREYGVPQTDTFRLPKGSKYRVELQHVATDPNYDYEPKPDYDYVLEIDTSQNCLVLDDPEGMAGYHYESDSFFADGKEATLYVPLFKPKEVSFSASTVGDLQSDDTSTTYYAPHWQDGNDDGDADDSGERKYPIAYVRDTAPTIEGKIAVKPTGLTSVSGFTAKIKVTGPGAIKIDEIAATIGTEELTLPATASTGSFVNEIDYLNPMNLTWEVDLNDEGSWCEAGTSAHRTYVTLGLPGTALRQETLFDLGCRNADGQSVAADAVAAMWADFSDKNVSRIDSVQMKYWNPPAGSCQTLEAMLADANANGTCVAWSRLLKAAIEIHGIGGAAIVEVESSYANDGSLSLDGGLTTRGLFLVKDWTFTTTGTAPSGCAPFTHLNSEVEDSPTGASGQGNANPPGAFFNHFIVEYSEQYYDPSYGNGSFGSQAEWENASLDGFQKACDPGGGAPPIIVNKPNELSIIETIFTPIP